MDPITALGVAAAAFQFLELGGKLCVKAWEKYKQIQEEAPHDQKLAEEEQELSKTLEDLSFQMTWIRQVSTDVKVSDRPTPTERQLSGLSSECRSLSSNFEQIESQMKLSISRESNSEVHARDHGRFGTRFVREQDCKECRKREDEHKAEVDKIKEDVERIKKKLVPLKRQTLDSMLISLWDDSKRTMQWELHFSNQLDKLIDLLGNAEKLTTVTRLKSALSNQIASSQGQYQLERNTQDEAQESGADEEVARLRNALQPLIQPGERPISLKQLVDGINEHIKTDNMAMNSIRGELVKVLWKKDWRLDTSTAGDSSARIDTTMVADAIAKGIQFNNIQKREDAISKSLLNTYSWIFQEEPSKKDGMPMWNSFPKWLKDDSHKVYWVTGKPGSGKSTLMKLIMRENFLRNKLSQSLGQLRLLLVKYYAWLAGTTLQKSLDGLKKTIIIQALEQYPELTPALTPRRWAFCQTLRSISDLPAWHEWEVEESFEALLSSCGKEIKLALFIDGLDEFDIPPTVIIECIRNIKARCPSGLKLCAASRPWMEFQDEFNESPRLQMHLLTEDDMKIFVKEKLKDNRGLAEQKELFPEAVSQLFTDIVQRANGVFLWVSVVVQLLSSSFSAGQSISRARRTLEALPTDISSLYDTIWKGISSKNLADASYLMQVLRAFDSPMPWYTLWVIEETRFAPANTRVFLKDDQKDVAVRSLKRKLAALTKCILEISGDENDGTVDYIHRTARDWAAQPENWKLICSSSSEKFDPHLCILKAKTLFLTDKRHENTYLQDKWKDVARALWHASEVKDIPENVRDLVDCLNSTRSMLEHLEREKPNSQTAFKGYRDSPETTPPPKPRSKNVRDLEPRNNFLGLAAQFSILPYIKASVLSNPTCLYPSPSKNAIGLLENAIFGYYHYDAYGDFSPRIPIDRRLATVEYLLNEGVYQSAMYSSKGKIYNLRERLRNISSMDPKYYSTVAMYLDNRGFKLSMKSVELRIRSFFAKSEGYTTS
ncbi:hypothetical protein TrVFT333_006684 [Trichoderma virens FT-333]|nr:hypothetical protein TrVFT333_006684 [Trichoderma virens FT-333]